jgi:hypothetical protein
MTKTPHQTTPLRRPRFDDKLPPKDERQPIPVPALPDHYASTPDGRIGDEALKRLTPRVGAPSRYEDICNALDNMPEETRLGFKSKKALFNELRNIIKAKTGNARGLGYDAMDDAFIAWQGTKVGKIGEPK